MDPTITSAITKFAGAAIPLQEEKLTVGALGMAVATNLALKEPQILAPGPEIDEAEENKGYLFSGATNNTVQGMPVPLAYGELVIGGTPISINYDTKPIVIGSYTNVDDDEGKVLIDYTGGEYIPPKADETTVTTTDDDDTTTDKTTAGGGGTTSDDGNNPDERPRSTNT